MKQKAPSKRAQRVSEVQACVGELEKFTKDLQFSYKPEIVRAALNRHLYNQRERDRIDEERAKLRAREVELDRKAARL